jgi:hypothetical protein
LSSEIGEFLNKRLDLGGGPPSVKIKATKNALSTSNGPRLFPELHRWNFKID